MAKVYDIVERLESANKRSTITIDAEHTYEVNTSKNTAILMQGIASDEKLTTMEKADKTVEAGIGKEALNYINSLDLTMEATQLILNAIMAAVAGVTLEEAEAEAEKEAKKFRNKK